MMNYFKVGDIVEIEKDLAEKYRMEDCVGVLFKKNYGDFFPYKIRIKSVEELTMVCTEDEMELTNKPLCKELLEWKRKHIIDGMYIEYPN